MNLADLVTTGGRPHAVRGALRGAVRLAHSAPAAQPAADPASTAAVTATPEPQQPPAGHHHEPLDLQGLLGQLGGEVAASLSLALERVTELAATGRIERSSLRALRDEIDRARRAGMMGQQVVRLGNGRVQLAHERLDLTALLREALRQRVREIEARGIEVRQTLAPATVISDATLLFSFLQTMLDWCFEHAASRLDLRLDIKNWPSHARLMVGFAHLPADQVQHAAGSMLADEETKLNTVAWRLLQQTGTVLGLQLDRVDAAGRTELVAQFAQTVTPQHPGLEGLETDDGAPSAHNSQPLAGRHVLVMATRREVRSVVRDALRPMGLMLDFVGSVVEAQDLCLDGLPHAVVYESSLGGDHFEHLRAQWLADVPTISFICIAEQGKAFEVLNVGGRQFASVGRDAIAESLPAALLFELSRND
jgi:hypothetical protein